jgi:hypothetical protein
MQDINEKQNIEIAEIKTEIKNIKEMVQGLNVKVDLITTNCIPTLTKEVAKMEANQKILMAFMFAVVAALIGLYFR